MILYWKIKIVEFAFFFFTLIDGLVYLQGD